MKFALNHNNKRIHAKDATKQDNYICPLCHKKVILRRGDVNVDHFAHQSKCNDTWKHDMSAWHYEWQQQFPEKNQEVVIEINGEKHRADVMACGYIIEFQHSSITAREFNERNQFYLNYGKKVVWIFDFLDEFENGSVDRYDEWSSNNDNGGKFKWSHPKRFLKNYLPQRDKDITVFFQFWNSKHAEKVTPYMDRVIWAIDKDGYSSFKNFYTSHKPGNFYELLQWIKKHKL